MRNKSPETVTLCVSGKPPTLSHKTHANFSKQENHIKQDEYAKTYGVEKGWKCEGWQS